MVLACVFWGVGFPIAKVGITYIHPFVFAFIRFFAVGILFVIVFRLSVFNLILKLKSNFTYIFLMALSGIFLYGVFFLFALKFAKASDVSLISGANPIITAVIAWILLKENLSFFSKIGVALSFLGIVFIVSKGNFGILYNFQFNLGDLFMLVATTMWAFYSVISKKALKRIDVFEAVCLTAFLGALMFFLPAIVFGNIRNIGNYPLKAWLSLSYMVVFSTIFAFSAWYKGIEKIGASRSSVFVNLVPVFGVITSVVLLKERFCLYELIGGFLVIAGVVLTNTRDLKSVRIKS